MDGKICCAINFHSWALCYKHSSVKYSLGFLKGKTLSIANSLQVLAGCSNLLRHGLNNFMLSVEAASTDAAAAEDKIISVYLF